MYKNALKDCLTNLSLKENGNNNLTEVKKAYYQGLIVGIVSTLVPDRARQWQVASIKRIRDDQWKDLSFHTSLSAAWNAVDKNYDHLELYQWDDLYRVIYRKTGEQCERIGLYKYE